MMLAKMLTRRSLGLTILCAAGLLLMPASQAHAVVFDFESATPATNLPSLIVTEGTQSMTVTRNAGAQFSVVDMSGVAGAPAAFETRSLWSAPTLIGPFTTNATAASLSTPTTRLAVSFSDPLDGEADGLVVLTAFAGPNLSGALVANVSASWLATDGFPNYGTLVIYSPSTPFQSVSFSSDGTDPNSMYWDNVSVPEPTTLMLLGLGLGAAGLYRRRRMS